MMSYDEPVNENRAARIQPTLSAYAQALGDSNGEIDDTTLRDMLADVMHWCDANKIDFAYELSAAISNYVAEKTS
jgi:hypothetical protein